MDYACSMRSSWVLLGVVAAAAAFAAAMPQKRELPLEAEPARAAALAPPGEPEAEQTEETDDAPVSLAGEVLETLAAGNYTCLRLKTTTGELWAAVPRAAVALHRQVVIAGAMEMRDFTSPTLKRTFERIYFGTLADAPHDKPASAELGPVDPSATLPPGHPDVAAKQGSCADSDGTRELPAGHPPLNGADTLHAAGARLPPGHPAIDREPPSAGQTSAL